MSAWSTVPLKSVVGINERALPDSTPPDFEFRYVDIAAVGRGRLVAEPQWLTFEDSPSRARRLVRSGDTIMSTVRTYLRAVWPVRDDDEPDSLVVSTGFAVLTPRQGLDPRFFSWFAQSDPFIDEVVARSTGVSYPAINAADLGRFGVPMPSAQDQRAVADFLNAETARIDALITRKRRLIELVDEREAEAASQLTLGSRAPLAPLRWFMRVGSGVGISPDDLVDIGGIPVVGGNGHMGRTLLESRVTEPCIAVGRVGALCGNVHLVDPPAWITDNALWVRDIRGFDRDYLAAALRSLRLNDLADKTAQPLITGEVVKSRSVPRPSVPQQREIAERLRWLGERVADVRGKIVAQVDLLVEHRQALITAAVMGELGVPGVAA